MKLGGTDLVAGEYEGGLKLWECSLDLVEYIHDRQQDNTSFLANKRVLELGCGHALPGMWAPTHVYVDSLSPWGRPVSSTLCTNIRPIASAKL